MRKKLFLSLLLFLILPSLYASDQADDIADNADTVYVIREINFDIDGRTQPFALMYHGEFKEGERIAGMENFYKYLSRKQQLLYNQRVLEDVRIEYFFGDIEEDGALPVSLLVFVKDTSNVIVLPYPKYDSNEGLSLTLKARDYNFLGTMSALRMDLGYRQSNNNHTINFSVESETRFLAASLNWYLLFNNYVNYTFGEPVFYKNMTGLSLDLPWRTTSFTFGLNQFLTLNEGNSYANIVIYGLAGRYDGLYGSTEPYVSWRIPFGVEVYDFGELAYSPRVSFKVNYPYGNMDESRKPVAVFSHSIGFGAVNWTGNYRKGLSVSLGNEISRYFDRTDAPLRITIDGDMTFHQPFSKYIGISSRLKYRQWWQHSGIIDGLIPYYGAGDLIRGVMNSSLWAFQMLSLNVDLPIRVLRFWPSEWFDYPRFRFFNFEMHASPFADMALLEGPDIKMKFDDVVSTAGIEFIVFPDYFRSLNIRASFGYSINKLIKEGPSFIFGFIPKFDEVFIGLEHHY